MRFPFFFALLFSLAFLQCTNEITNTETETPMQPGSPKNPLIVGATPATIDAGTTADLVSGASQALSRVTFDRPRALTVYAYWSPEANNPAPTNFSGNYQTVNAGLAPQRNFGVLATLIVGLQQAQFKINFDIPYGQLVAIPVVADHIDLSARIIASVWGDAGPIAVLTNGAFNTPPQFVLAAGEFLPNVQAPKFPQGVVHIVGLTGEGSIGGQSGPPATRPTRRAVMAGIGNASTRDQPLAWGATHVSYTTDDATAPFAVTVQTNNPTSGTVPIATLVNGGPPIPLTNAAFDLHVNNVGGGAARQVEIIQYIGL